MPARQFRKTYPATLFNISEPELCRELEAYLQAINSYPDYFAKTGVTFEQHLLNVIAQAGKRAEDCSPIENAS
jgi:hypothetical protein